MSTTSTVELQVCSKCWRNLPVSEFAKDSRRKNGLKSWCRLCNKDHHKKWSEDNKESIKGYNKKYYDENVERYRDNHRKFLIGNPTYYSDYYERNKDRLKLLGKIWRENNPETVWFLRQRRRALLNGCEVVPYTRWDIFLRDKGICGICGNPVDLEQEWIFGGDNSLYKSIDHIIPISRKGGDTPNNVRLVHMVCNQRKFISM